MSARPGEESGGLFTSAASDYARYRPGIPGEAVRLLADRLTGVARSVVLDLGSGTGQVAAALLPAIPAISRMDLVHPDPGMLHEATAVLAPLLDDRPARFHCLPAEDFTPPFDGYRVDLVTCARAFHWMDRPAVLATADRVAAPDAAVAIMSDGSLWTHEADWTRALRELIQRCLGTERRAGTAATYREPHRSYEEDLAASAWSEVTEHRFPVDRAWAPMDVIGYLRSTSFAAAVLFGERHAAFEAEARTLLEAHASGGPLTEQAVFTVLLARRPGGA